MSWMHFHWRPTYAMPSWHRVGTAARIAFVLSCVRGRRSVMKGKVFSFDVGAEVIVCYHVRIHHYARHSLAHQCLGWHLILPCHANFFFLLAYVYLRGIIEASSSG